MGALKEYPPLQRATITIPAEVLSSATLIEELGLSKLLFIADSEDRKLAMESTATFINNVKGVSMYKLKNGTIYGITSLKRKVKLNRFYSFLVELTEDDDVSEGIADSRQKLILTSDHDNKVVAYLNKNDSQTVRVRINTEVVDDGH